MTRLFKRTATLVILATLLVGSAAQAANASGKCLTPNQVAAQIRGNLHDRGIVESYKYWYFENNSKLRLYGLTERNVWSVFIMEMCRGSILQQIPLRGRPAGI